MLIADVLLLPTPRLGTAFALAILLLVSASVAFVVLWNRLKPRR